MKTALAQAEGHESIRKARLTWIAQVLARRLKAPVRLASWW